MAYVIDTSVLMKRVLGDDGHQEMRSWIQEALDEEGGTSWPPAW